MGRNIIETVMGAVVLAVAAVFVFFAYNMAEAETVKGYEVKAAFYKVGGLKKGSDVRVSGIKVGTVIDLGIDAETYDAVVSMSVADGIKLPVDTVAGIASEGVLGGKYVRLEPGTEKTYLEPGEAIAKTKDFRSLEDQVGEIIFLATSKPESNAGEE
ncbi:MAG: MlaD family protein [Rhodospirillales bacterium]|jgi:phospholipid/cholesterol/gamma-HCH transport system substrate-binding protein|nr:MlaD family protein [Rhodospirillales bacterium]MDP6773212.1 MlaD family protein [Rhodospirillales bacterium]|tara:strand:- start:342 stop:812 length:471 start_codon:yes stop_codon:yes gene_type:complete